MISGRSAVWRNRCRCGTSRRQAGGTGMIAVPAPTAVGWSLGNETSVVRLASTDSELVTSYGEPGRRDAANPVAADAASCSGRRSG